MTLVGLRIDDRLLHGQVVENWIEALRPRRVLVANDAAARDPILAELYLASIPPGVEIQITPLAGAAALIRSALDPLFVLVGSPADALTLVEDGVTLERIVVGGLHHEPGREKLLEFVYLGDRDRAALLELLARGIALVGQDVPRRHPVDLEPLLLGAR
jgi:mannose/fructose/N-acetylgalactosamine-specific phosphotransferase system component IIB